MRITAGQLEQIVDHARHEAPNECCGVLAVRDGTVTAVHVMENAAASPLRFDIDGRDLLRVMNDIEDGGDEMGVVYHSHTRSAPAPSQTDLNFAANWPGVEWLIVGLAGDDPEVRHWAIEGGVPTEVPLEVDG